jgi:hypothetical protein
MNPLVAEYLRVERELLAHRCVERLAGRSPHPDDAYEQTTSERLDSLWDQMTPDLWRELRAAREARSAPWFVPRGALDDEDSPAPATTGLPPRRRADPFRSGR